MAQQGDHVSCDKRIAMYRALPPLSFFMDNDNIHGQDEGKVLGNWNGFMMITVILIIYNLKCQVINKCAINCRLKLTHMLLAKFEKFVRIVLFPGTFSQF